nr:hypothetical protein [Wolbachia endosymbiont (group B) of Erebia ligea]
MNTELEPLRFFYDTVQPILLRRKLLSHEQILNLGQVSEFFLLHLIFKLKTLDAFFKIQDTVVNFPTLHNKYIAQREIADKRTKKHNNIICIYTTVSATAVAVYIGLITTTISNAIIFATITGIFALIIAIMISEMSKRYIENEFQKKMFMELEECSSTVNDVEIEPAISRVKV